MQRVTGNLQQACIAVAEITPVKVKDYAVAQALATIPLDAVILRGYLQVFEAFDPGTSLTVDLGEANDPNRFTTAPISLTAKAVTALIGSGAEYGQVDEVKATFVLSGAEPTIGKAYVYIEYLRPLSASGVG